MIYRTPVPARDSIIYIRYAVSMETNGWQHPIIWEHHHPGFPASVLACSWVVRLFAGEMTEATWQFSAQLASSLAGLILVVPMFYIGKLLNGRAVGCWGSLLFQLLPLCQNTMADGISDPLFLLLVSTSWLFAYYALNQRSLVYFALCGGLSGLAYLVRPEGAAVALVTGIVLLIMQMLSYYKRSWSSAVAGGITLTLAGAVAASPYFLAAGTISRKPNVGAVATKESELKKAASKVVPASNQQPSTATQKKPEATNTPITNLPKPNLFTRAVFGFFTVIYRLIEVYCYVGLIPFLIGFWWCRDKFQHHPGVWVGLALSVLHFLLLWILVIKAGYVSGRHLLLLVICTIFQATTALTQTPMWLAEKLSQAKRTAGRHYLKILTPSVITIGFLLVLISAMMAKTFRNSRMTTRNGYRAAGQWLATNLPDNAVVEGGNGFANYYCGRTLAVYSGKRKKLRQYEAVYKVVRAGRKGDLVGERVYHWPEEVPVQKARIFIYRVH